MVGWLFILMGLFFIIKQNIAAKIIYDAMKDEKDFNKNYEPEKPVIFKEKIYGSSKMLGFIMIIIGIIIEIVSHYLKI